MAWKKLIVGGVWSAALLGWAALFIFKTTDPTIKEWTMAVTGTALLTEIAFWATAAVLGLTLWESRKAVFRTLLRPFRRNG